MFSDKSKLELNVMLPDQISLENTPITNMHYLQFVCEESCSVVFQLPDVTRFIITIQVRILLGGLYMISLVFSPYLLIQYIYTHVYNERLADRQRGRNKEWERERERVRQTAIQNMGKKIYGPFAELVEHSVWIRRLWVKIPSVSRHFFAQNLWHFHKNIRSWVEN